MIFYDITNFESFRKVKSIYQTFKENNTMLNPVAYLIGNKLDLVIDNPQKREVTYE